MIKRLNNIAKIPSADTISNKITNIFNYEQANLQKKLQEILGKISFTLDTWTSKNQKSFIGVIAHWISKDWKLQQCTIEFCHFEGSHSGKNLAEVFFKILKDNNLLTKVIIIITIIIIFKY